MPAAGKKVSKSQISVYVKFSDLMKRKDFKSELEAIGKGSGYIPGLNDKIKQIMLKYKLPFTAFDLVRNGILEHPTNAEQVLPAVQLLSQVDNYVGPDYLVPLDIYWETYPNKHVLIEITGEAKRDELLAFVENNWDLISSKLKLIAPYRKNAVRRTLAEKVHDKVIKLREVDKLSYREIAIKTGLTEANIKAILYRIRRNRKK